MDITGEIEQSAQLEIKNGYTQFSLQKQDQEKIVIQTIVNIKIKTELKICKTIIVPTYNLINLPKEFKCYKNHRFALLSSLDCKPEELKLEI